MNPPLKNIYKIFHCVSVSTDSDRGRKSKKKKNKKKSKKKKHRDYSSSEEDVSSDESEYGKKKRCVWQECAGVRLGKHITINAVSRGR